MLFGNLFHHDYHVRDLSIDMATSSSVAYDPTEEADDTDKDSFSNNDLASAAESVPIHDIWCYCKRLQHWDGVTFNRALILSAQVRQTTCKVYLSFCCSHIWLSGSRMGIHWWTLASNDGRTKKEIDHIITKNVAYGTFSRIMHFVMQRSSSQYWSLFNCGHLQSKRRIPTMPVGLILTSRDMTLLWRQHHHLVE